MFGNKREDIWTYRTKDVHSNDKNAEVEWRKKKNQIEIAWAYF